MPRDVQIRPNERVELHLGDKIPVPVRDYEMLVHKPMLNGVELIGDYILKLSDLENDAGYISIETDPTVPAWAKQPNKPVYTAEEIGAMPNTVVIPVRVSQLENDSGYYTKPAGGIPLSDFAPGVIPDFSSKIDMSMKGARGGVAELDQNGMVPSHQLPSYVDDVKTYSSIAMFPTIGEDDKIYIDKSTNKQYRWSGDIEVGYVPIASSLALGETAQTAYRGDRGKIAYDHAVAKGQAYESGLYKLTTNAEGHVVLAVSVTKEDITALGIPGEIPDSPVQDIQFNNVSILQNGIANVNSATSAQVKEGTNSYSPIAPNIQHESVFYALAKIAGHDEKNSMWNAGTYSPDAKHAILNMLGVPQLITDWLEVDSGDPAPRAIAKDSYFVMRGWLYKATQDIAKDAIIIPDTNCVNTRIDFELSDLYHLILGQHDIKADKTDTVLLTTLSNGRKANTTVGLKSIAWGKDAEASGNYTVAIGEYPKASGIHAIAVGDHVQAMAESAAAFGYGSKANGTADFVAGYYAQASGGSATAFGNWTEANGQTSQAGGSNTVVNGDYAFGNGYYLIIDGKYQNGIGVYNYPNGNDRYTLHAADLPEWEIKDYRYGEAVKHTENGVTTIYVAHQNVPEVLSPLNDPYNTYWVPIDIANILNPELIPEWDPEGTYAIGDRVKQYYAGKTYYFECNLLHPPVYVALTNGTFWHPQAEGSTATIASEYLELVGNGHGSKETLRSNARMLDVYGNEYLMGDVYVKCGANGDNGKKLITADDIPSVPVTDVQIKGTTILQNGIANIPAAAKDTYGVVKLSDNKGLLISANALATSCATSAEIKTGVSRYQVIVPSNLDVAAFYGLARAANDATQVSSANPVGTYTDEAKSAIQKLFGLDGVLGDYESATAGKAYAIGETFIYNGKRYSATVAIAQGDVIAPGTNCKLDPLNSSYVLRNAIGVDGGLYVKGNGGIAILASDTALIKAGANNNRPITAYTAKDAAFYGLAKAANDSTQASSSNPVGTYTAEAKAAILAMLGANGYGLMINDGTLQIQSAGDANIKAGNVDDYPIVPYRQHKAVYYGLSKLAGVDLKNETVTVGVYPQSSKTAIQTMLGIEADIPLVETVTGAIASITGMPNVRYICDTAISELTITPPASGSIVVRFTAGSNCIVSLPQTVKLPEWFDISSLEAGTTYELIISDGVYGGVMSWAA